MKGTSIAIRLHIFKNARRVEGVAVVGLVCVRRLFSNQ